MERVELKTKAKAAIKDKILIIFAISLVVFAAEFVAGLLSGITVGLTSAVAALAMGCILFSFAHIFLNMVNKNHKPAVDDLLIGFKKGNWDRATLGYIRYYVFTALWSMLLIVPGIIKALAYSQMFYLLAEDKKLTAAEAQKKSMAMMQGHKAEYFVLQLSFFWWYLLCGVTFGVAYIYVLPYVSATDALYYNYLKGLQTPAKAEKKPAKKPAKK